MYYFMEELIKYVQSEQYNVINVTTSMEELIKYVQSKQYNVINVTTSILDETSYKKYIELALIRPKVVMYFEKNILNELLFDPRVTHFSGKNANYIMLHKNRYMAVIFNNGFDQKVQETVDKFLYKEITCQVCDKYHETLKSCFNCMYMICKKCSDKVY